MLRKVKGFRELEKHLDKDEREYFKKWVEEHKIRRIRGKGLHTRLHVLLDGLKNRGEMKRRLLEDNVYDDGTLEEIRKDAEKLDPETIRGITSKDVFEFAKTHDHVTVKSLLKTLVNEESEVSLKMAKPEFLESLHHLETGSRDIIERIISMDNTELKKKVIDMVSDKKIREILKDPEIPPIIKKGMINAMIKVGSADRISDKESVLKKIARANVRMGKREYSDFVSSVLETIERTGGVKFFTNKKILKHIAKFGTLKKLERVYTTLYTGFKEDNPETGHRKASSVLMKLLNNSGFNSHGIHQLHEILPRDKFREGAKTGHIYELVNRAIEHVSKDVGVDFKEIFGEFKTDTRSTKNWTTGEVVRLLKKENARKIAEWKKKGYIKEEYTHPFNSYRKRIKIGNVNLEARLEKDFHTLARDDWDCLAPRGYTPSGVPVNNFSQSIGWLRNESLAYITYYIDKKPVGRAYIAKANVNGEPAVIVDSLEYGNDLDLKLDNKKVLLDIVKDFANKNGIKNVFVHKRVGNRGTGLLKYLTEPEEVNFEVEKRIKGPLESYTFKDYINKRKGKAELRRLKI